MLELELADGFEFGFTLSYGADQDSFRLPRKFGEVVDVRTNQVVLRVRGGAIGIWPTELLFDRTGTPYLTAQTSSFRRGGRPVATGYLILLFLF
jgi:hypothetical protein